MHAVRWLGAGLVATLAAYTVYGLAWKPLRCNITKERVQSDALRMWNRPDAPQVATKARDAIVEMERCIVACPTDIDMYMTRALNDRLIGRFEHAEDMYREALKYDRRPELFFNLGIVQLEMKQRQAAIITLTKACSFEIRFADAIPDLSVREEVVSAVQQQRAVTTGSS